MTPACKLCRASGEDVCERQLPTFIYERGERGRRTKPVVCCEPCAKAWRQDAADEVDDVIPDWGMGAVVGDDEGEGVTRYPHRVTPAQEPPATPGELAEMRADLTARRKRWGYVPWKEA